MSDPLVTLLNNVFGLPTHEGKVRYSYSLDPKYCGGYPLRAVYVSDNISSDDFVFSDQIPIKGEVLNAMSTGVKVDLIEKGFLTDLVAYGRGIDEFLNDPRLQGNEGLWKRLTIVEELEMLDGEVLARGYLKGTAARQYIDPNNPEHIVYGVKLPDGLRDGDPLPEPLFTVSTKAKVGHDVPQDSEAFIAKYPGSNVVSMDMYRAMCQIPMSHGQGRYLDTKYELGRRRGSTDGRYFLADEVGTPDSSRLSTGNDKEMFRVETRRLYGIDKLDPKIKADVATVSAIKLPPSLIRETSHRYQDAVEDIFGVRLATLQERLNMAA